MHKPKMIIFDYGQTLVDETGFDVLQGTRAVLNYAVANPYNASAEEIAKLSNALYAETIRLRDRAELEVHNHLFQNYLYDYFGIEFSKSMEEIELIFENTASSGCPTKGIETFLQFLENKGIRSGVISNISFSGKALTERINRYIPSHKFEFIIATSEYVFRKPHRFIFELALRKAGLEPGEVWYCGDNAVCDIDGAGKCGMVSVWYKGALLKESTQVPQNDCLKITAWDELLEVLEKS